MDDFERAVWRRFWHYLVLVWTLPVVGLGLIIFIGWWAVS